MASVLVRRACHGKEEGGWKGGGGEGGGGFWWGGGRKPDIAPRKPLIMDFFLVSLSPSLCLPPSFTRTFSSR